MWPFSSSFFFFWYMVIVIKKMTKMWRVSNCLVPLGGKKGRMEEKKKGAQERGGGVVASQLEKDWITAVRKVSANTNSPWSPGSVWAILECQTPHPPIDTSLLCSPNTTTTRQMRPNQSYVLLLFISIWMHPSSKLHPCYCWDFKLHKELQCSIYESLLP